MCLERKGTHSFAARKATGAAGSSKPRVETQKGTLGVLSRNGKPYRKIKRKGKEKKKKRFTAILLSYSSQRARFGKDLKLQGLKQGLGEKSENLRLNEELLQAREAALKFKQHRFPTGV